MNKRKSKAGGGSEFAGAGRLRAGIIALASSQFLLAQVTLPVSAQLAPQHAASHNSPLPTGHNPGNSFSGDSISAGQLNAMLQASHGPVYIHSGNVVGNVDIPKGAILVDDAAKNAVLNIQGNLVDSGRLLFTSADPSVVQATLNANSILVHSAASIASLNNISLTLNAHSDIINNGAISSAANLNINAGGSITNALAAGTLGKQPLIQAANNLDIVSGAGLLTNAGLISAVAGNVSIATLSATNAAYLSNILGSANQSGLSADLLINNLNGTISSLNGSISADAAAGNLTLNGGDFLSQSLNFTAQGNVMANIGNASGVVNVQACNAHLYADAPNLQVGIWNVSGDPVIANVQSIALQDTVAAGPLVVVSGKDITWTNGGNNELNASGAQGSNVYLIAGAKFLPDTSTAVTITGASPTGGKIDFSGSSFAGIDTSASSSPGNGGNVEISAFKGSAAGSGMILFPATAQILTSATGAASSGHVYLIAGASTNSSSTSSIDVGTINTSGGTGVGSSGLSGGHVVIATQQPNVSGSNPMIIDSSNGSILRGGIIGGAIANSPVSTGQIFTGGGQLLIEAGMGITASAVIDTSGSTGRPGGAVILLADASGKNPASSDISVTGITTFGASGFPAGAVTLLSSSNITATQSILTSATDSNSGSVTVAAGTSSTQGTINLAAIDTGASGSITPSAAGAIAVLSAGLGGINISGSILAGSTFGDGGPVTISSPGAVNLTGSITSTSSGGAAAANGGSVFISSGQSSGTSITSGAIDTSTSSASGLAGGVYLIAAKAINAGSITQTQSSGSANSVVAQNFASSGNAIAGNAGNVTVTLSASSISTAFNPGGYLSVNDQSGSKKGGSIIALAVQNDPNVVIPLVSLSSSTALTLTGTSSAFSGITTSLSGNSSFILFSPGGINVGSSNSFISSSTASSVALSAVSNTGNISIANPSTFFAPLVFSAAASSTGTVSLSTRGGLTVSGVTSGATPAKGFSISLDSLDISPLTLNGNLNAGASIALMPTGSGNIIENTPSVFDAGSMSIGSSNLVGNVGSSLSPLFPDLNRLTITTNPSVSGNSVTISAVADMTVSFKIGGSFAMTGGNAITVDNSSSPSSASFVQMSVASIQALKSTPAILSPLFSLQTSQSQGIGSSSIPLGLGNLKGASGAIRVSASAGSGSGTSGDIFLSSKSSNDIEVLNTPVFANNYSIDATGNVILDAGLVVTAVAPISVSSKAGIFATGGTAQLNTTATMNLQAGAGGIGIGGNSNGTLELAGNGINIKSAGDVTIFAGANFSFAGASTIGNGKTGTLTLFAQSNSVLFLNNSKVTVPNIFITGNPGTGTVTQLGGSSSVSIASSSATFVNETFGGISPLVIQGGTIALSTTGRVNLFSQKSVLIGSSAEADGGLSLELASGNITQQKIMSSPALLSNSVSLIIDGAGSIGSSSSPLTMDTGFKSTALSLTVQVGKGSAFLAGTPDPSTNSSTGLSIGGSSASQVFSLTSTSPISFDSTSTVAIVGGKSLNVSSSGLFSTTGGAPTITSPSVSLSGAGTSSPISLSSPGAGPVNLTVQASGTTSISAPSIQLIGASTLSSSASLSIISTTGSVAIGKGATVSTSDSSPTTINIQSATDITQASKGTALLASSINLQSGSTGSIGSSKVSIGTSSGSPQAVALNASSVAGDVFISNAGPVSLVQTGTTGGDFHLTSTGLSTFSSIFITNQLNASNIFLQSAGGILVNNPVNTPGTLSLSTGGDGSISGNQTLTGANLLLSASNTGSIGFPSSPLQTAASVSITANAGKAGEVNISNTGTNVLLNKSSAGGVFNLTNAGTLTINGVSTNTPLNLGTGSIAISVSGASAVLNVAPKAVISARGGGISLQNLNTPSGTIDIGKGAKVSTLSATGTNGGTVYIAVGNSVPTQFGQTPLPTGLKRKETNGGTYSLGETIGSCVAVNGTGNVLNLIGQNVIFDTGAGSPQNITLEGGVIITADPVNLAAAAPAPAASVAVHPVVAGSAANLVQAESVPSVVPVAALSNSGLSAMQSANWSSALQQAGSLLAGAGLNQLAAAASSVSQQVTGQFVSERSHALLKSASGSGAKVQSGLQGFVSDFSRTSAASSAHSSVYEPISVTTVSGLEGKSLIQRGETSTAAIFCEENTLIQQKQGDLNLVHGKTLLVPKSRMRLIVDGTECLLERGCAVLACYDGDCVELVNLTDGGRGQVKVTPFGASMFTLDLGQAVVLGNVGRHKMRLPARNVVRGSRMINASVSIPYVLSSIPLAKGLRHSSLQEDRQIFGRILKACAALSVLKNRLPYTAEL